ncbi:hypothetical protein [Mangrovibacterium lignilyticum]|uniref:hypothetical protein n=1 Tax=Mangrovibacterium lignilyticum TaxID=2668052 RepID=UPI0013D6F669|nr:hypothetical protein [Mangrovibacterium lignilyticum]
MKTLIQIVFIVSILISCNRTKQLDIYGTWTTLDIIDNTGLDIKDKVDFNKDGTYKLVMISGQDSIISQMNGTFLISDNKQELIVTTNGMTFKHTILSIEKDTIKLKNESGQLIRMKHR